MLLALNWWLSDEWLGQVCRKLKPSLEAHLPLVEARLRQFLEQCLSFLPVGLDPF